MATSGYNRACATDVRALRPAFDSCLIDKGSVAQLVFAAVLRIFTETCHPNLVPILRDM